MTLTKLIAQLESIREELISIGENPDTTEVSCTGLYGSLSYDINVELIEDFRRFQGMGRVNINTDLMTG
jgi:hypothetical protein